jgi:hypothetical protein
VTLTSSRSGDFLKGVGEALLRDRGIRPSSWSLVLVTITGTSLHRTKARSRTRTVARVALLRSLLGVLLLGHVCAVPTILTSRPSRSASTAPEPVDDAHSPIRPSRWVMEIERLKVRKGLLHRLVDELAIVLMHSREIPIVRGRRVLSSSRPNIR